MLITNCPRRRSRRRGAFTLLEVLVATAVFALSAALIASTYVNILEAYETASKVSQNDQDLRFARACLLAMTDIEKAQEGDQFESSNGRRVTWSSTIEPTLIPDLFRVELTCEIAEPGSSDPKNIVHTFNLFRPTWSLGTDREALRLETRRRIQELDLNTPSAP